MIETLLKKESYKVIEAFFKDELIDKICYFSIINAKDYDKLIKALSFYDILDEDKIKQILYHVMKNVWMGVLTKEQRCTVFDQEENIFFKEILKNNGIMSRKYTADNIFRTEHINDRVATNLEEMGIIDIIRCANYEVIYILNIKFYNEVFCRET